MPRARERRVFDRVRDFVDMTSFADSLPRERLHRQSAGT
jgi:hypothetical protein